MDGISLHDGGSPDSKKRSTHQLHIQPVPFPPTQGESARNNKNEYNNLPGSGTSSPLHYKLAMGQRGLTRRASSIRSTTSTIDPRPEILAPQPQRNHLLDHSKWLRSQSISPTSSRAISPAASQTSFTNLNLNTNTHTNNTHSAYDSPSSHSPLSSNQSQSQSHGTRRKVSSLTRRAGAAIRHQSFTSSMYQMDGHPSHASPKRHSNILGGSTRPTTHHTHAEVGMGRRWIRWMDKQGMKDWIIPGAVLASTCIKWCVGLGSYSGKGTPPLFGDYEAQRHWMELTIHLPVREWYKYDLKYWGLDYPPLTAYHSWICGLIGSWVNPSWFELDTSRGIEGPAGQVYMRSTVLTSDLLVYVPALVMFVKTWQSGRSRRTQSLALLTLLLQPSLLLIDFGHFQFNSVMLGFTLLSINSFAAEHDILGAIFFVLALGFKQMALYYAPAIGSYLLAKCIYLGPKEGYRLFTRLALTTLLTFLLLFLPFLPPFAPLQTILDPITRIFPFQRGLFEDKVANFWCASNVVVKWRNLMETSTLVRVSALFTVAGFLQSVVLVLSYGWRLRVKPASMSPPAPSLRNSISGPVLVAAQETPHVQVATKPTSGSIQELKMTPMLPLLPYALLTSSLSFFLFSFQVHEKTILVPLLPMTLLMSASAIDSPAFQWGVLMNNIGMFSMWPLLKRDGLGVQYVAMLVLWNRLIGCNPFLIPSLKSNPVQLLSFVVYATAALLHILEVVVQPPARFPDIFPVMNVLVCTPVFMLCWLWSIKSTVEVGWALRLAPGHGVASSASTTMGEQRTTLRTPAAVQEGDVFASNQRERERAVSLGVVTGTGKVEKRRGLPVGFRDVDESVE